MISENKKQICISIDKTVLNALDNVVKAIKKENIPITRSHIIENAVENYIKQLLSVGKEIEESKKENKEEKEDLQC